MGLGLRYNRVNQPKRAEDTPTLFPPQKMLDCGEISLGHQADDDSAFVEIVASIIDARVQTDRPRLVMVIEIDGWFDQKWVRFAGTSLGTLGRWPQDLAVPAFHPNRVLHQTALRPDAEGIYQISEEKPLHIIQHSVDNLRRRLRYIEGAALFAWWSHVTLSDDRASLMVYQLDSGHVDSWYAGFQRQEQWCLGRTREISPAEVQRLMDRPRSL